MTHHPSHGSLGGNRLCGIDWYGDGTYTTEAITKLCEGLKGSAVTSLRCVTAHRVFAFVSTPIDTAHPPTSEPHLCSLALNQLGPEGGAAIAEGLKGNSTLQSLE